MHEMSSRRSLLHLHPQLTYEVVLSHVLLLKREGVGLESKFLEPNSTIVLSHAVGLSVPRFIVKIVNKRSRPFKWLSGRCFCVSEWIWNVSVASVILAAGETVFGEVW